MRRADRLFQLVQFLRTRRAATGQQIAEELGVSLRTVYRHVADLQNSGIPIRGEAGVGYRLDRGSELPPLTFTGEELEGLALGARIGAAWGDADLATAVNRAMNRIESVLPSALRQVLLETPLLAPEFQSRSGMSREVATIRRAIGERRVLRLHYERADGDRSDRVIRPLGLHFWGDKWTVAAWCELRDDYRSFRPDRMLAVEWLERTFETDGEISLAEFLKRVGDDEPHDAASH